MPLTENVIEIPATIPIRKYGPIRVAAYCRISSLFKQESSLSLQLTTYRQMIRNNHRWIYAGVFMIQSRAATVIVPD